MKPIYALVLMLCLSIPSYGADHEFRGVVHAIESSYGVHHMHIPLLGVAVFFARPEGVSRLKLAVFENFNARTDPEDVKRLVERSLGSDWVPVVRVRSKADTETTLIYTNPSGGKLRMMIVNVESSEATVVEMNLSERALKQWIDEPKEKAEGESAHGHHADF